jgi:serine/threonine protein kinase
MEERYEIKGRIGRGGVGAVYQAYDRRLGRDVAIKRLLALSETKLNDINSVSLEKEALALAKFQHPNVVSIYEIASDSEGSFVVFELVKGETLKATIARSPFTLDDFTSFADQTLDPLISAQELNLLHRDIKPGNIMLTWLESERFRVKLLDFGLAKFSQAPSTQTLDQTGSFLGSIDYIAPEQIEVGLLDQRTDLYSLGCVYYFSLTQQAPFAGSTVTKTMDNHLKNNVVPLGDLRPDLPIPLVEWVMRLISRHPDDRPDHAVHAMQLFQEVRDATAATPGIPVRATSLPEPVQPRLALPPVPATAPSEMDTTQLEPTKQLFSRPLHTAPQRPIPKIGGDIVRRPKPANPKPQDSTPSQHTGVLRPHRFTSTPSRGAVPPIRSAPPSADRYKIERKDGSQQKILIAVVILALILGIVVLVLSQR